MNIWMYVLTVILLLLMLILIIPIKVRLLMQTEDSIMLHTSFQWMYPLLKVSVFNEEETLYYTIYVLNQKIRKKRVVLSHQPGKGRNLLPQIGFKHVEMRTVYGFADPAATGMAYGLASMLSQYMPIDSFDQYADFTAEYSYMQLRVSAQIYIATLLYNMWMAFIHKQKLQWNVQKI